VRMLEISRIGLFDLMIWAQARVIQPAKLDSSFWIWNVVVWTALGIAIFVGVWIVYSMKQDATTKTEEISVTEEEQLAEFERAYEAGEMEELEIRKVRETLRRKMGLESLPSASMLNESESHEAGLEGAEKPPEIGPEAA
jgi:hypothetical protein